VDPSIPRSITSLLQEWSTGSPIARNELIPLVYNELKNLSQRVLGRESDHSLTATALVHDLYLKLAHYDSVEWTDRAHFFSFCAHVMRQILIDHARERLAEKRSAVIVPLGIHEIPWAGRQPADYLDLDRTLERLSAAEPEKARVVELRVFLGCTSEETADILGIGKATVDRHMAFARAWLFRSLRPPGE
jgi:RNA polymerase sigma factor (TIGR02999 family)